MAIAGFAGLPRFLAPATAVIAILGGVGLARTAAGRGRAFPSHGGKTSAAIVAATLVIAVAGFAWRAAQVPGDIESSSARRTRSNTSSTWSTRPAATTLLACQDQVSITQVREQTALAWKLDEPDLRNPRSAATPTTA